MARNGQRGTRRTSQRQLKSRRAFGFYDVLTRGWLPPPTNAIKARDLIPQTPVAVASFLKDYAVERENFDAGTNGANLLVSDGIMDGGTTTAPATVTYDNSRSVTGSNSMLVVAPATGVGERRINVSPGDITGTLYLSVYIWLPSTNAQPNAKQPILTLRTAASVTAARICVRSTDNTLGMDNGTSGVGSSLVWPGDQWMRIDWSLDFIGQTQLMEVYWGSNLHGLTPNFSSGSGANNATTGMQAIRFGVVNALTTDFTISVDAISYSFTRMPAPVGAVAGSSAQVLASQTVTSPTTVAGAATVGTVVASGTASFAATTVAATATVGAPAVSVGSTLAVSTVSGVATVGTVVAYGAVQISAATVAAVASSATPTVTVGGPATVNAATVAATAAVGLPQVDIATRPYAISTTTLTFG